MPNFHSVDYVDIHCDMYSFVNHVVSSHPHQWNTLEYIKLKMNARKSMHVPRNECLSRQRRRNHVLCIDEVVFRPPVIIFFFATGSESLSCHHQIVWDVIRELYIFASSYSACPDFEIGWNTCFVLLIQKPSEFENKYLSWAKSSLISTNIHSSWVRSNICDERVKESCRRLVFPQLLGLLSVRYSGTRCIFVCKEFWIIKIRNVRHSD